jgi:hypothetical protein
MVGLSECLAGELAPSNIGVSAFCPGPVQSNIRELGKLRPEKYKKDTGLEEFEKNLAQRPTSDLWMDPVECGERVVRGIERNDLYIFTHPEFKAGTRERCEKILASFPDEPINEPRAEAIKFLIHLVGDVHQPFHAIDVARGGNGLGVTAFGSTNCAPRGASPFSCTLHGVWDSTLIAHRRLNDDRYLAELERAIAQYGWSAGAGAPADWANESHALAKKALLPAGGVVDEHYAREQLRTVDERLARAGLRLAALLNRRLG